jgi:hypothetical protein
VWVLLVGADGKPSRHVVISPLKTIDVEALTGRSLADVLASYKRRKGKMLIEFSVVDIVKTGTERAEKLVSH